jgi:hypothetical protein
MREIIKLFDKNLETFCHYGVKFHLGNVRCDFNYHCEEPSFDNNSSPPVPHLPKVDLAGRSLDIAAYFPYNEKVNV